MDIERKAASWAERNHGLIRADVATGLGFSRDQIERRLRDGRWHRVRDRVYRIGGAPQTWEQQLLAALWTSELGALASHASALRLRNLGRDARLELTTAREHHVRIPGVISHRSLALPDPDRTRRGPFALTSVARTIVDVSGRMSPDQLGSLIDEALQARVLRLADLERCAKRLRPARGRRLSLVHDCLALRVPGYDPGDSDLETRAVRALIHAGLPAPRQQHKVRVGGRKFELDLAYPDVLVAMELDGWDTHGVRTAFDYDRERSNLLLVHGWLVLHFTARMSDDEIVGRTVDAIELRRRVGAKHTA